MAVTTWDIRLYDVLGAPKTFTDNFDTGATTNQIQYAVDPKMTFVLNGIDTFTFSLYLDDDAASEIEPLTRLVKVWRNINDPINSITYTAPATQPDFAGVIGAVSKSGEGNLVEVSVFNPLWRVQFHFHILNHLLVVDNAPFSPNHQGANNDGSYYTQSSLMFKLIDLVNGAFGNYENGISSSGIVRPLAGPPYWSDDPEVLGMAPYFVPKGSNTWANIAEDLLSRYDGVDIVPEYYHSDGSGRMMYFNTEIPRGSDISATTTFDYMTGDYNCSDMTEDMVVEPGKFANYLWAVGQGGPNKAYKVALVTSGRWGMTNAKINMRLHNTEQEINTVTQISGTARNISHLQQIANAELARAKFPTHTVTATLKPIVEATIEEPGQSAPYYGIDYSVGDVVAFNANKGAFVLSGKKQRIYQVTLGKTEGGAETAEVLTADDFYERVAAT